MTARIASTTAGDGEDERLATALRRAARGGDVRTRDELASAARARGGPGCRVELAQLAVMDGRSLDDAAAACEEIVRSRGAPLALRARAQHVLGQARARLREPAGAVDALNQALDAWRELDDEHEMAEVEDALGSVFFSVGRFDLALASYATSLASKAARGDRAGIATTLGNVGRVHLRASRLDDALRCFERDLSLCAELGDERGRARVLEDLGRVHLARGDLARAEEALRASLALSGSLALAALASFAHKDLAIVHLRRGELDAAELEIDRAAAPEAEPYAMALAEDVRARIALARDAPDALERLESAARRFAVLDVPDDEIATRVEALRAACARGELDKARSHFDRAVALSSRDGYARWARTVRELALELQLARGPREERGRLASERIAHVAEGEPDRATDSAESGFGAEWTSEPSQLGYVMLRRIGRGGFGEVWESYDPELRRTVAIKRLRLEELFEVGRRAALSASMRAELEATRLIDHPLVARVLAIGRDDAGATYVAQELVRGRPLRESFGRTARADAIRTLARIGDALAALHEAGVVHRDLKPENVIVRARDGLPVLVDFGIAHVDGRALESPAFAGTYAYMAPERRFGEHGSAASDVWSLGTIAREWLFGFDPKSASSTAFVRFEGESARERERDALRSLAESDCAFERLVALLVDPEPSRRPSAREAAIELEGAAET